MQYKWLLILFFLLPGFEAASQPATDSELHDELNLIQEDAEMTHERLYARLNFCWLENETLPPQAETTQWEAALEGLNQEVTSLQRQLDRLLHDETRFCEYIPDEESFQEPEAVIRLRHRLALAEAAQDAAWEETLFWNGGEAPAIIFPQLPQSAFGANNALFPPAM